MRKSSNQRSRRNREKRSDAAPQQASVASQPQQTLTAEQKPVVGSPPAEPPSRIKRWSEVASFVQSLLTIAGILAAGIWFIAQSESSLKANITHSITHKKIHDDWTWIHVSAEISNVGKRRLDLRCGVSTLYTILPLDIYVIDQVKAMKPGINSENPLKWPTLRRQTKNLNNDIYPGETDRIDYEFVVPSFINTAALDTFFYQEPCIPEGASATKGWSKFIVYDLNKKGD